MNFLIVYFAYATFICFTVATVSFIYTLFYPEEEVLFDAYGFACIGTIFLFAYMVSA